MSLLAGAVHVELSAKDLGFKKPVDEASNSVTNLENKAKKSTSSLVEWGKKIGAVAVGIGVALGGVAVKSIFQAGEMEKMNISLASSFRGTKESVDKLQKEIVDFANKTPFKVGEVQDAFIKLNNYGLTPSQKALSAYGDTASAMGKDLNQMIEAVADASSGEFERLKEFGIRSAKEGDNVMFTFRGVTTTVKNNAKEIENYLIKLGETNFGGGMEKQSQSFLGKWDTFVDTMSLKIGEIADKIGLTDISKQALQFITDFVNNIDDTKINQVREAVQNLFNKFNEYSLIVYNNLKPSIDFLTTSYNDFKKAIEDNQPAIQNFIKGAWDLWQTVQQLWGFIVSALTPSLQELQKNLEPLIQKSQEFWTLISPYLIPALKVLAWVVGTLIVGALFIFINYIKDLIRFINFLIDIALKVRESIGSMFNEPMKQARDFFNVLKLVYDILRNILKFDGMSTLFKFLGIPGFASGVTNFGGGMAYVHEGETLQYLPKGTDVNTKGETMNMALQSDNQQASQIVINVPSGSFVNASSLDEFFKMAKSSAKRQGFATT